MSYYKNPISYTMVQKKTPLSSKEAMKLQYLREKVILQSLLYLDQDQNHYLHAMQYFSEFEELSFQFLIADAKHQNSDYESCEYVFENMCQKDIMAWTIGHKGLALLAEISYFHTDYTNAYLLSKQTGENFPSTTLNSDPQEHPILQHTSYSYIHKREIKYQELLQSLGNTFKDLIQVIDTILILNYYLDICVEVEELECIRCLQHWMDLYRHHINNEQLPKGIASLQAFTRPEITSHILDLNHDQFITALRNRIDNIPSDFEQNTRVYVEKTIHGIVKTSDN